MELSRARRRRPLRDELFPPEPLPQRITRVVAWVAGALILVGCGALISLDVVLRAIFGRAVVESFEISGYCFAAAIGLGLAFTVTSKSNIRIDILVQSLPPAIRRTADILAALSLAAAALALAWYCFGTLAQSWRMDAKSISTLQVPLALPQGIWWIGMFWFAFMAVLVPLQAIARLVAGQAGEFDRTIGSLRVTEEIAQAGVAAATPTETQASS
jgi:TRAP-type C4-dicarboxylate transport system permease small subunit